MYNQFLYSDFIRLRDAKECIVFISLCIYMWPILMILTSIDLCMGHLTSVTKVMTVIKILFCSVSYFMAFIRDNGA